LLAGMCVRRDSTPTYHTVHSLFLAINRQCAPPVGRDVPHRRGKLQPGTSLSKGQNFPAPVRNKEKRVEPGGIFPDMILPCLTPSCGCGTSHGFLGGSTCSVSTLLIVCLSRSASSVPSSPSLTLTTTTQWVNSPWLLLLLS